MEIKLPGLNPDGTKITLVNTDGNTKVEQPTPPAVSVVKVSVPLENPDFIPSPVAFKGQERKPGEKLFNVQLKGEPHYLVFAIDRLQAIERYNLKCGIIGTTNQHSIEQLD